MYANSNGSQQAYQKVVQLDPNSQQDVQYAATQIHSQQPAYTVHPMRPAAPPDQVTQPVAPPPEQEVHHEPEPDDYSFFPQFSRSDQIRLAIANAIAWKQIHKDWTKRFFGGEVIVIFLLNFLAVGNPKLAAILPITVALIAFGLVWVCRKPKTSWLGRTALSIMMWQLVCPSIIQIFMSFVVHISQQQQQNGGQF